MKAVLLDLFTSKKFLVFAAGAVTYCAGRFGFSVDQSVLNNLVEGVSAYLVGQGIADHGKEAAQVMVAAQAKAAA
jgi:hypothetical protein